MEIVDAISMSQRESLTPPVPARSSSSALTAVTDICENILDSSESFKDIHQKPNESSASTHKSSENSFKRNGYQRVCNIPFNLLPTPQTPKALLRLKDETKKAETVLMSSLPVPPPSSGSALSTGTDKFDDLWEVSYREVNIAKNNNELNQSSAATPESSGSFSM